MLGLKLNHVSKRGHRRHIIQVTPNINDMLNSVPWVRQYANDLIEWGNPDWKSLANCFMSDQDIVIQGEPYIILFLTGCFMPWTQELEGNKHRLLILALSPLTVFSNLVFWNHHSCPVTWYKCEVLELWYHILKIVIAHANWCKVDIH